MFKIKITTLIIALLVITVFNNCGEKNYYPQIPDVYVSKSINLDLPLYSNLQLAGSYMIFPNDGYKGILLYHNTDDQFIALELACPYQSQNACAKITPDSSGLFLRCGHYGIDSFEECCGSRFQMDGNLLQGPSTLPMKRYYTSRDGNTIYINN